ncbi:MAG: hypothetical protein ACI4JA_06760 [Oscillospiraceae bacterium]
MVMNNSMLQCFGYDEAKNECSVLVVKPCKEKCAQCKFFKTKKQFDKAILDAEESLMNRGLKRKHVTIYGSTIVTAVPDYD